MSRFEAALDAILARPGRLFFVLAVLVFTPLFVQILLRRETLWDNCYLVAARELAEGRDPYDVRTTYVYPPLMAWLSVPFVSWPLWLSRAVMYLANVAMVLFVVRSAWRLAGGGALSSRKEHGIFLLGLASGFLYLFSCLSYLQSDLFIAALVFGGCLLFLEQRSVAAATVWGIAAGAKCTPLLFVAFLVWRMQWRAATWLVVVAVGVNLLPELTHPAPRGTWLTLWLDGFIAPLANSQHTIGNWHSGLIYNQSIQGAAARIFLFDPVWSGHNLVHAPRVAAVSAAALKKAVLLGQVALLASCFLVMRFGSPKPEKTDAGVPRSAFEMGVVMILMLMLSPMTSKYHLGLLILPGFALARQAFEPDSRPVRWLLGFSLVLVGFVPKSPWGTTLYSYALWYNVPFLHEAILLAGCLVVLWQQPAGVIAESRERTERVAA
jgi:hypothetical protein